MPKTFEQIQQEALELATVMAQKAVDLVQEYEAALTKIEALGGEAGAIANEVLRKHREAS